jgi:hypothetical protein
VGKITERQVPSNPTQEETSNLNNPLLTYKIVFVVQNFPTRKNKNKNKKLSPDSFTGESNQTFEEKIIQIPHKLFQKVEEIVLLNSFYEASITWTLKPKIDITRKETIHLNLNLMNINAKSSKLNFTVCKRGLHHE